LTLNIIVTLKCGLEVTRPLSRAAATFPAGAPTKIRLAAAGDFSGGGGGGGGIRRDLVNGGTSHY